MKGDVETWNNVSVVKVLDQMALCTDVHAEPDCGPTAQVQLVPLCGRDVYSAWHAKFMQKVHGEMLPVELKPRSG